MIKIAVLGYGTVGSGVVEVIARNQAELSGSAGEEIKVKYILDSREFPGDPNEDKIVHDFNIIVEDEEIRVVCEAMGGTGDAYLYPRRALEAGKSVCTSNKELVARHGAELMSVARERQCNYMFEASVGGGIPIIRTLAVALSTERIEAVTGILNGTTNYILSQMESEHADYHEALARAQRLGYAERNPEADVKGHDACRKIAILASLVSGRRVDSEKVYTEGIDGIKPEDFAFASKLGMTIKLLAVSRMSENGRLFCMVAPFLLPLTHPLASVCDVFNGVLVRGNMLGDTMFYGRGAGKLPTASAVAADVADCVRNQNRTIMRGWDSETAELYDIKNIESRFFVRCAEEDRNRVREVFCGEDKTEGFSLEGEYGFFTPVMKEEVFGQKRDMLGEAVKGSLRLMSE